MQIYKVNSLQRMITKRKIIRKNYLTIRGAVIFCSVLKAGSDWVPEEKSFFPMLGTEMGQ